MKKQMVCAILCTAVISGILAGCGSKSDAGNDQASSQNTEASAGENAAGSSGKT